ncbi:hypothetical protein T03_14077 [Trichinella britovi]|uniref:Uncharacterized protein n=1 Tax=Trichinella britovi TaxID=45882 RepID=A0A0V1D9E4_TRIBR|nr:hypothetical protein T03_14077 [Trichinella britovi]
MKEAGSRGIRIEQCISPVDCGIEVPMHKNRFPALRYANNDHHKGALSSRTEQRKSENTDDIEANHGRREAEQEKTREQPFTLDFGKSYLLQRVETYLSSATNAIDQQPIRQPTYPPFVHSLVACSTSLLSSPYALRNKLNKKQ